MGCKLFFSGFIVLPFAKNSFVSCSMVRRKCSRRFGDSVQPMNRLFFIAFCIFYTRISRLDVGRTFLTMRRF